MNVRASRRPRRSDAGAHARPAIALASVVLASIALLACGRTDAHAPKRLAREDPVPSTTGAADARAPASTPTGSPDATARDEPDTALSDPPARTPLPPIRRSGRAWPFHKWDRAEAVTFNRFAARPRVPIVAVDDGGVNPTIADRKPLTPEQGRAAIALAKATDGGIMVSQCAFPRHAVILYEGDLPVASLNVCFECGDIVLWPDWRPLPKDPTPAQWKQIEAHIQHQIKLYDAAFPRWRAFFRDEIGFPIDETYR